jgi:hypothetical protein
MQVLKPQLPYQLQLFTEEVMSQVADTKAVMVRATELRMKQGLTNSAAMKQAWAEARVADAKAKAEAGNK